MAEFFNSCAARTQSTSMRIGDAFAKPNEYGSRCSDVRVQAGGEHGAGRVRVRNFPSTVERSLAIRAAQRLALNRDGDAIRTESEQEAHADGTLSAPRDLAIRNDARA